MNQPGSAAGQDGTEQPLPTGSVFPESKSVAAASNPAVPDYELLRRIDKGSFGEVWLARSKATGILRAAKIVWQHTFEEERPYQREFEGVQKFERVSREHPSQLALFHIGRNDAQGYFYYVMELADGIEVQSPTPTQGPRGEESNVQSRPSPTVPTLDSGLWTLDSCRPHTLRAGLSGGRLPAARVLEIGIALTEALSHLHRHGLVHRDVKPSNVIFVNGHPKLADIGLVTDTSDQRSILGTEGYLLLGSPGTPQADIFALGKVLYEAVTGMDRLRFPELPQGLRSWVDARLVCELNEVVLAACAPQARAGYGTADAMLADLRRLQMGSSVRRSRAVRRFWLRARRAAISLAGLTVLAGALALVSRSLTRSAPDPGGPPSTIDEANILSDKGFNILRSDNYAQMPEAYTNFIKAIALDRAFARPYAGLLEMRPREHVSVLGDVRPEEMRAISQKLGELAPNSAAAACASSMLAFNDLDFPRAESLVQKAIKAAPNYELARTWYGEMLTRWGRVAEAREQLSRSKTLMPSKVLAYRMYADTYYMERDFAKAIEGYKQTLGWERRHHFAYQAMGRAYRAQGNYTNAIANFRTRALANSSDRAATEQRFDQLLSAYLTGGERGYWKSGLDPERGEAEPSYYFLAMCKVHLGDKESAISLLREAYESRERWPGFKTRVTGLLFDECWDCLHDDPRFQKLLDDIGFTRVMRPRQIAHEDRPAEMSPATNTSFPK